MRHSLTGVIPTQPTFDATASKVHGGGDLKELKARNRQAVFDQLRSSDAALTVRALERTTGLTRPTVTAALRSLIDGGYVLEAKTVHAGGRGGPRSKTFGINPRRRLLAGTVIRLQSVEVMVTDWLGAPLGHVRVDLEGRDPREVIEQQLAALLADLGVDTVFCLVVGVIGSVDAEGALRRNADIAAISAPGYFAPLERRFGTRLLVENDAYLAASAEFVYRSDRAQQSMVGLHIDIAIGCGIIVGGRLVRGADGLAAELNYLPGSGWRDSHERLLRAATDHGCSVPHIFVAAKAGEEWATTTVKGFLDDITPGLLALVITLNPELLVIGGDCCPAGDLIAAHLTDTLARTSPVVPEIHVSALGNMCVILGAIHLAASMSGAIVPIEVADPLRTPGGVTG